ncbi:MAG: N-acetylmuramoyl-L-alanine amidase family protein [Actinomycetota bacterium]
MVRRLRHFGRWLLPALTLLMLAADPAWARPAVGAVRLGLHEDGVTRFVMDVTEAFDFKVHTQADPYRVVIDAPALEWTPGTHLAKPWGAVRGLSGEDGRLVLDLKSPVAVKQAFVIAPRDGMGWRFVVDLRDTTQAAFLAGADHTAAPPAPHKAAAAKPAPQPAPQPAPKPVAVAAAPPPPPAPSPVEAQSQTVRVDGGRIVVLSPNAQPAPEPVAAQPVVVPQPVVAVAPPVPATPAASIAPPPQRPVESRMVGGSPVLSAPMPPPPERPVAAAPTQAAMAVPEPVAAVVPAPAAAPPAAVPASMPVAPAPERKREGPPVIVVDPGHGGMDPGATGVSGTYEKFITLAMARELKSQLEKGGKFKVVLTRDRDVFIRLRDRVAIARQANADLFISLHADAVQNPQIKGLSVYTLSQNASDAEAQALAEKENKADLIAGIDLSHESADVANILIDLAQRETMNRSAGFAAEIVDEVGQELDLLGNTHRFAGFAVLKAPDVPAVLVEMGYLSNEVEERDLRQPVYRARLAKSIARAVERFFLPTQKARRP